MRHAIIVGWGLIWLLPLCAQAEDKPPADAQAADPQATEAETQALAAAESWLALVDKQQYAESWDAAAGYLQATVGKDAFVKSLEGARKPLGKVLSRELKSKAFRTSLPGAPDGKYVLIQFKTSLANKKSAVETVTPMLDKDNQWHVSGYFVK